MPTDHSIYSIQADVFTGVLQYQRLPLALSEKSNNANSKYLDIFFSESELLLRFSFSIFAIPESEVSAMTFPVKATQFFWLQHQQQSCQILNPRVLPALFPCLVTVWLCRYPVSPISFLPVSIAKSDAPTPSSSVLFCSSLLNFKTAASYSKGAPAFYLPPPQNAVLSERLSSKIPKHTQNRQDAVRQLKAVFGSDF